MGWLITQGVVADSAATFAAIKSPDLDGRIFAISKSSNFASFVTITEMPSRDIGRLVTNELVPPAVQDVIIGRFAEFTVGASATELRLLADLAIQRGKTLTFAEVQNLASEGLDARTVVPLLQPHLSALGLADLAPVLNALVGEYEKLSGRTGKHPRLDNTPSNRALVDRLTELGIVASRSETPHEIRVNMRQP